MASPYNTYEYGTPGPIAMDITALAVINPEKNDFIYFCARAFFIMNLLLL
jgi:cell division protein YceG involved in septum cleavage